MAVKKQVAVKVSRVTQGRGARKAGAGVVASSGPLAAPESLAKEPSSAKYVAMAGAMEAALDRMRVFYQTLAGLKEVLEGTETYRKVILHPSERQALLDEVTAAANILRVGLKARGAK